MTDIAHDTIVECIADLTEDEAIGVLHRLRARFGWAGTMFTRADAESTWADAVFDERCANSEVADAAMPDEVWDAVQASYYWRKAMPEMLTEHGWQFIELAVQDALGEEVTA